MTAKTLEQEAVVFKVQRGQMVWRLYASGMCTDEMIGDRWTPEVACVPPQEFLASFIAAATARDKEIEELRARVKELEKHLSKTQVALVHFTRTRGDRILDRDFNWLMLDRDMEDAIINAHNKEHND